MLIEKRAGVNTSAKFIFVHHEIYGKWLLLTGWKTIKDLRQRSDLYEESRKAASGGAGVSK